MSLEVQLPDSAWEGVDVGVEALLDQWLVAAGDTVRADQPLAKVVLVKATVDVAAPVAGRVESLRVAMGDTFKRGEAIATLAEAT